MKKQIVSEIKNSKPFKKGDFLVYAALVLIILSLFLTFVIFPSANDLSGFTVEQDGKRVLTYSFSKNDYEISPEFIEFVEITTSDDGIYFKIYRADSSKFNTVYVDFSGYADVTDSNCSTSSDCVHSPEIRNTGAIVCVPNRLKISPLSGDTESQPVVG